MMPKNTYIVAVAHFSKDAMVRDNGVNIIGIFDNIKKAKLSFQKEAKKLLKEDIFNGIDSKKWKPGYGVDDDDALCFYTEDKAYGENKMGTSFSSVELLTCKS